MINKMQQVSVGARNLQKDKLDCGRSRFAKQIEVGNSLKLYLGF